MSWRQKMKYNASIVRYGRVFCTLSSASEPGPQSSAHSCSLPGPSAPVPGTGCSGLPGSKTEDCLRALASRLKVWLPQMCLKPYCYFVRLKSPVRGVIKMSKNNIPSYSSFLFCQLQCILGTTVMSERLVQEVSRNNLGFLLSASGEGYASIRPSIIIHPSIHPRNSDPTQGFGK